jgi:hypothetical protein
MVTSYKRIVVGVLAALLISVTGSVNAWAAQVAKQEKKVEKKTDKSRVKRIERKPCVFVASSHRRGMLGVRLTNLTPELRAHFGAPMDVGVMISEITPDSPAAKAGLQVGDIITGVDDKEVSSSFDLARTVRRKEGGELVELQVLRDKTLLTVTANIEERERSEVDLGHMLLEDCDELDFDFDFNFEFDEEAMEEAIENATRHLENPEWKSRMKWIERLGEGELEEKLKELEKKLEKMEEELKELEAKKKKQLDNI